MSRFVIVVFLLLLTGCYTFYDRSGHKYKQFRLSSDHSKYYFKNGGNSIKQSPSKMAFYTKDSLSTNPYRLLTPGLVESMAESSGNLLLLFWNPHCKSETDIFYAIKRLDSLKIPFILISLSYDTTAIASGLRSANLKERNVAIIPADIGFGNKMVLKKLLFIRDLCPQCYLEYQGELTSTRAMIYQPKEKSNVFLNLDIPKIIWKFNGGQ